MVIQSGITPHPRSYLEVILITECINTVTLSFSNVSFACEKNINKWSIMLERSIKVTGL